MIFVSIASYRDPECEPTVRDLLRKARNPHDIRLGIVIQAHEGERHLAFPCEQARFKFVSATASRGACWARHHAMSLYGGEDYVLQIDAHMRFAPNWDVRMLDQLTRCQSGKPILTCYPGGYIPPDELTSHVPCFLAAKEFSSGGMLVQQGLILNPPPRPKQTAFVAAGFLFGHAQWISDAPYDPNLYFQGEETTLAVRLWTHGWDFFGPSEPLIWHLYETDRRPLHWSDNPEWWRMDAASLLRVRHLLGRSTNADTMDLGPYGLGEKRTLAAYQRFSGVDFIQRTIASHALAGEFG